MGLGNVTSISLESILVYVASLAHLGISSATVYFMVSNFCQGSGSYVGVLLGFKYLWDGDPMTLEIGHLLAHRVL